jgi:hypothetical protein
MLVHIVDIFLLGRYYLLSIVSWWNSFVFLLQFRLVPFLLLFLEFQCFLFYRICLFLDKPIAFCAESIYFLTHFIIYCLCFWSTEEYASTCCSKYISIFCFNVIFWRAIFSWYSRKLQIKNQKKKKIEIIKCWLLYIDN